jgi:hypothetical protein
MTAHYSDITREARNVTKTSMMCTNVRHASCHLPGSLLEWRAVPCDRGKRCCIMSMCGRRVRVMRDGWLARRKPNARSYGGIRGEEGRGVPTRDLIRCYGRTAEQPLALARQDG